MNSGDIVSEGFILMLLGMGTVFVFLTILVLVTSLMSSLVLKYAPAKPAEHESSEASTKLDDQRLVAVISAAIHAHRSRK